MYEPIPSLDGKYEISPRGYIRNAKTKRLIRNRYKQKYRRCVCVSFKINGKRTSRSVKSLLAEVFGIESQNAFMRPAVSATVIKGNIRKSFPSFSKCSAYLQTVTRYKRSWLMALMARRTKEIDGWQLLYREPEQRIFRDVSIINGDKDLRRRGCD